VDTTIERPIPAAARPFDDITRPAATITVTRRLAAPAGRIFDAWLDAALTPLWLFATATRPIAHAVIDPRPFGKFELVAHERGRATHFRGQYLRIERLRRIAFALECPHEGPGLSQVDVVIREADGVSDLRILHSGVPAGRRRHWQARWIGMLYGLGTLLTQGDESGKVDGSGPLG